MVRRISYANQHLKKTSWRPSFKVKRNQNKYMGCQEDDVLLSCEISSQNTLWDVSYEKDKVSNE